MGPYAYYSPIAIGFLLTLILNAAIQERLPASWTPTSVWITICLLGIAAGLLAQLLMIGSQGIAAQVLPVPVGRSLRGRPAVLSGFCVIATVVLLGSAAVMSGDSPGPARLVAVMGVVIGLAGAVIYAWGWPTATRDFDRA